MTATRSCFKSAFISEDKWFPSVKSALRTSASPMPAGIPISYRFWTDFPRLSLNQKSSCHDSSHDSFSVRPSKSTMSRVMVRIHPGQGKIPGANMRRRSFGLRLLVMTRIGPSTLNFQPQPLLKCHRVTGPGTDTPTPLPALHLPLHFELFTKTPPSHRTRQKLPWPRP